VRALKATAQLISSTVINRTDYLTINLSCELNNLRHYGIDSYHEWQILNMCVSLRMFWDKNPHLHKLDLLRRSLASDSLASAAMIDIFGLRRGIKWGNYPCKTTSDVVHLMFISIKNFQIFEFFDLGQRHLTEHQIGDQIENPTITFWKRLPRFALPSPCFPAWAFFRKTSTAWPKFINGQC
jgi:hypothetical protein